MREIKFRVWDKDLAKYLEGCEIDSLMAELSAGGDGRQVVVKQLCPARYIFEQYTGVKDKNSKEIYEGDIVTLDFGDGDDLYSKYEVKFDDEYRVGFEPFCREFNAVDPDYTKIVGNIHENPELLEEDKGGQNTLENNTD